MVNKPSDTPRTDDLAYELSHGVRQNESWGTTMCEHARTLERELAHLRGAGQPERRVCQLDYWGVPSDGKSDISCADRRKPADQTAAQQAATPESLSGDQGLHRPAVAAGPSAEREARTFLGYEAMCKGRDQYFRDLLQAGLEWDLRMSAAYARGFGDAWNAPLPTREAGKWVPMEPTMEMLNAAMETSGMKAINDLIKLQTARGYPLKELYCDRREDSALSVAYRAMLAASPSAQPDLDAGRKDEWTV